MRRLLVAHNVIDDARRPCGTPLSIPHAWALLELRQSGPLTIKALAARLNIDRTNVSRLCARMTKLKEIKRAAHPDDKRAQLVALTRRGEQLANMVDTASTAHFSKVLDRLEGEVAPLIESLDHLTAALSTGAE
ncbi:MAG: MarR family winged helix-turn-helix transcriptional regulator [Myxococcota bacterium]